MIPIVPQQSAGLLWLAVQERRKREDEAAILLRVWDETFHNDIFPGSGEYVWKREPNNER